MSNELLTVDGLDMRQGHMGITTRSGRYTLPGVRGEGLVVAGRSGYIFTPNRPLEPGIGALSGWVLGATSTIVGSESVRAVPLAAVDRRKALEDNLAALQRLFSRRHRLLTIRAYAASDGTVRRAFVEPDDMGDVAVDAGGTRATFSIGYSIPDVFWEDEDARTQAATVGATLPKTLNLTQFSDMTGFIEDGVFTVAGPITNPRITDTETGAWVQYTGTVPNGQSWVVDSKAFTSIVNGVSVMAATKHVGGYRLLVIPNLNGISATPQLVLSGTSGGAATNLSVSARRKWFSG